VRFKESDILRELESQEGLGPLVIDRISPLTTAPESFEVDALIEFSIQGGASFKAAAELLAISTPKAISQKLSVLKNLAPELKRSEMVPMIIAPYISRKDSARLIDEGVSWIDLSGNLFIKILPAVYIERTGKPNKFPDTSPIKKIYEGTSSLVGRALLLNPKGFASLYEIVDFINRRNASITIATVSKVLKSLEEELIVSKRESTITLKNPVGLLNNLADGYWDYLKRKKDRSYKYAVDNVRDLETFLGEFQLDYAYCGFYAAKRKNLGMTDQITLFIKSMSDLKKALSKSPDTAMPDEAFGQVTLIETKNPCVWFNLQGDPNIVDDLELYLEMINDKPRGPKIAGQLKERILGKFNGK
jgi:hypothetical protein